MQNRYGSFRDPSGSVFYSNGMVNRKINLCYSSEYSHLMTSGLYSELVDCGYLIPHRELDIRTEDANCFKIIQPEQIPFISYPYEWCFNQLKDAALLTLNIQKKALQYGMSLKDASAYNIQFKGCTPIFIDTLSFEYYEENKPWVAYRQFCQHFLAPLSLMSFADIRLAHLQKSYLDGLPLDLASNFLPWKTKFHIGLMTHIHLHSKYNEKYMSRISSNKHSNIKGVNRTGIEAILDSLKSVVDGLKWKQRTTEWSGYYVEGNNNYSDPAFQEKIRLVKNYITAVKPNLVWDIGANSGVFSRLSSQQDINTIAMDIDPMAVQINYIKGSATSDTCCLPLIMDITNPSSSIGWSLTERMSLLDRISSGLIMALALIHHLVIRNNIPLNLVAEFLASLGDTLIIEFVPKEDSMVKEMLSSRQDIFKSYTIEYFRKIFQTYYRILDESPIENSCRTLFLMERLSNK